MSETVPSYVKPSGGLVLPAVEGTLPGIPAQPAPTEPIPFQLTDAALQALADQPRTWTFIDRETGKPRTLTCLAGCRIDHASDIATPSFAGDIWCETPREDVYLPVNTNGTPEEFRVLGVSIKVMPFSNVLAERLPYVCIEMVDDHWIEPLDPDGLETVITTLSERLDLLRETHAQLVRTRAEYRR